MRGLFPSLTFPLMFRPPKVLVLILLLFGSAGGNSGAQSVEEMRDAFESKVTGILDPVNRKYIAALRRLEKEFALEKNYESAIAVRDERITVEAMLGDAENGTTETTSSTPPVSAASEMQLLASKAQGVDGGATEDGVLKLSAIGQSGEWSLAGIVPGGYDVIVTYASPDGATLQAMEHFFRITADLPPTGDETSFKSVSLGTLKITSRALKLNLAKKAGTKTLLIQEVKLVSNRE